MVGTEVLALEVDEGDSKVGLGVLEYRDGLLLGPIKDIVGTIVGVIVPTFVQSTGIVSIKIEFESELDWEKSKDCFHFPLPLWRLPPIAEKYMIK